MKRKLCLFLLLIPVILVLVGCQGDPSINIPATMPEHDWQNDTPALSDSLPQDLSTSTGYYLRCTNGRDLFIRNGFPISISRIVGFEGLNSGDKILLVHGLVAESWPGQTTAYSYEKLEDGDLSNIDATLLYQLQELGWQPEDIRVPADMPEDDWQNDTPALPELKVEDLPGMIPIPDPAHIETCPAFPDNGQ